MVVKKIIPDAYTEYSDGNIGVVPGALANVEGKIGAAGGGIPGRIYTLSGPDAKKNAKTIFKSGALLKALEAAFDAGSSRLYACRIGTPGQASITIPDINELSTLVLKGDYGLSGNNHYASLYHQLVKANTGYAVVQSGTPNKVLFYDETMTLLRTVSLPEQVVSVVGITMGMFPIDVDDGVECWVIGVGAAPDSHVTIWHLDADGNPIAEDTLDIDALIPLGDTVAGIMGDKRTGQHIEVVTDKHILYILLQGGSPILDYALAFDDDLGITTPDITSAVVAKDLNAWLRGEGPDETLVLVDKTANKLYGFTLTTGEDPVALGEIDIDALVGTATPEGLAVDWRTSNVLLALREASGPNDRVVRLSLSWSGTPSATLVETKLVPAGAKGLGQTLYEATYESILTIQDRNITPWVISTYRAKGVFGALTAALKAKIDAGGVYSTELLVEDPLMLIPSQYNGQIDPTAYAPLANGTDGSALTNADYLAGLEALQTKLDINWLHAVGAKTSALWNAILVHCSAMFDNYQSERFAILETPDFVSQAEVGSAAYLQDMEEHVDEIVAMVELVGDRNAVIFAGGATFMGSDGVEFNDSVVAACGGTMASLEVQKSLVNKPVSPVLELIPAFTPGHIETLIQARVNCLRHKPGRGYVITHSLTAAAEGSDYSRVNDLRAVYYAANAARAAGQHLVGEENDAAGEGLRKLESAMSRPLESMQDAGQIDKFELTASSTANERLLGEVYVRLGVTPRRAMEMIYTTVYLK